MIATWEVVPPRVVQKPITRVRSIAAVSDGVRSSAISTLFGGYSGFASEVPVRIASTRRPTSRMSFARWASSWFFMPASLSAWVENAPFHANAALLPFSIADSAISSRSGSASSSSCAAKIAAFAVSRLA